LCENSDGPQSRLAGLLPRPNDGSVLSSPQQSVDRRAVFEHAGRFDTNVVRPLKQSRKAGLRSVRVSQAFSPPQRGPVGGLASQRPKTPDPCLNPLGRVERCRARSRGQRREPLVHLNELMLFPRGLVPGCALPRLSQKPQDGWGLDLMVLAEFLCDLSGWR
jgi:hypothetical protein